MKKIFTPFLLILILTTSVQAQVLRKVEPVICPIDHNHYDTFVPPPSAYLNAKARSSSISSGANANIVVNYNGFTEEARVAYQYAVDIWSSLLKTPVTIYVDANFADLGQGVLGSAGPTNLVRDFPGAPNDTTFYPIPLADKLAGYSLNREGDADINSNFSSTFDFYFGLDGNPPTEQFDFVSIVLHELGHGLGFIGVAGINQQTQLGTWGVRATSYPSIYTKFVELGDNTLLTDLPLASEEVADALTGDDLFFNALLSVTTLGERPKLFAPANFSGGSSYSHLDEATYPAGDPNSLMSPQFGRGEAIHDPGVALDMFADMGWIHTYLSHENDNEITNNITDPFSVSLNIISDTTFNEVAPVVIYTYTDFSEAETITMADTGDGINFSAEIPNNGTSIRYYFSGVEDVFGRAFTSPASAPSKFYIINVLNQVNKPVPYLLADGGDFETNLADFQTVVLAGNQNLWEIGTPENTLNETISGANVWKTKLSENIGVANNTIINALISPTFDFSDNTKNHQLSFQFLMDNALTDLFIDSNLSPFGFNIEYSLDAGKSWTILGEINDQAANNWYNNQSEFTFPSTANQGWIKQTTQIIDGETLLAPETSNYNVSFLTGNASVNFRFVAYIDQQLNDFGFPESYEADGILLDNFEIITGSPTAEFKIDKLGVYFAGESFNFEYISTGANSYLWDFGDGTTSIEQNPTHTYIDGGAFDVTLTITSADGSDVVTKENLVKIIPTRELPYSLENGGNLEGEVTDFNISNISGTNFELGISEIEGKSGAVSGNQAYVTGINEQEYQNDSEAYIYSPEFNFDRLGAFEFSFETKYAFEPNWDGFIVQYSLDKGENWLKLTDESADAEWYNQTSDASSVFGNSVPIFSGNTNNEFVRKAADVSFLGNQGFVTFRIQFLTDASTVDTGMAIDNFELTGPLAGSVVTNFSGDVLSGCEGTTVIFSNESTGTIKSLEWEFGEGANPSTASGIGPFEVVFEEAGNYNIKLTAEDEFGSFTTEEKTEYIIIGANHTPTFTTGERNNDFTRLLTASEGDAYQWFFAGDTIPGATEQTYLATEDGAYTVAVLINQCLGFSNAASIITSNNSALSRSLNIYPNPANQQTSLNISFTNEYIGEYEVTIYNISGALLKQELFTKNEAEVKSEISLKSIEKGLYIVNIKTGGSTTQRKIVIE